jgi:AcrR family transcriptional regulator
MLRLSMLSKVAAARAPEPLSDARRRGLLEAAITVFMRYGYRKTSMEEVARAAQVSRQGLYLSFSSKEDLFRAAVKTFLEGGLQAVTTALRDPDAPLESRLVAAFDQWIGRFVGMMGAGASDLVEAAHTLIGPMVEEHEALFVDAIVKAISAGGLAAAYKPAGLTARQLGETLAATGRGLKYGSETREAFSRSMAVAVRALCAPLGAR